MEQLAIFATIRTQLRFDVPLVVRIVLQLASKIQAEILGFQEEFSSTTNTMSISISLPSKGLKMVSSVSSVLADKVLC